MMDPNQNHGALFEAAIKPFWRLLHEDGVTEIQIALDGRIFQQTLKEGTVDTGQSIERHDTEVFIRLCADQANSIINQENESLDCTIFYDQQRYRISASLPPVSLEPQFSIRRYLNTIVNLEDLVDDGTLGREQADYLKKVVDNRHNLLISGTTGAGKTTLLNAILQYAGPLTQRFVVLEEDASEINTNNKNTLYQRNSSTTSIGELAKKSLRASPDKLIIGEIRDDTLAETFYHALTTGHSGSMSTIHGSSGSGVLERFQELLKRKQISPLSVAENLNNIIHLVMDPSTSSGRRVSEIINIQIQDNKPYLSTFSKEEII